MAQANSSGGDPSGRRLARQRAGFLADAGRVARALEVLLKRAAYPGDAVLELIKDLAEQEQVELQRAHGKIEPRRRFKGQVSTPLLAGRPLNLLYLDESGKSTPEPKQPGGSVFALGGVALTREQADQYCARADAVKTQFFGRRDFAFHEPYMRSRYQDPKSGIDYGFRRDPVRQREFDDGRVSRLL